MTHQVLEDRVLLWRELDRRTAPGYVASIEMQLEIRDFESGRREHARAA